MSARIRCYCGHSLAPLGPGSDGTHSEDDNSCMACAAEHNRPTIAPCLSLDEYATVARFEALAEDGLLHEQWLRTQRRRRWAETLSGRVIFP